MERSPRRLANATFSKVTAAYTSSKQRQLVLYRFPANFYNHIFSTTHLRSPRKYLSQGRKTATQADCDLPYLRTIYQELKRALQCSELNTVKIRVDEGTRRRGSYIHVLDADVISDSD